MSRFPGSFRNPFFGGIAHDEDEADGEDDEGQGYPFGSRPHESFGFSFGPGGSHFHGSFGFEEIFQDFHKLFTDVDKWMASPLAAFGDKKSIQLGRPVDEPPDRIFWDLFYEGGLTKPLACHLLQSELPSAGEYPVDRGRGRSLRDTMLKDPDGDLHKGSKGTLAPEEELKNIPGFRTPERGMPWRPFGRIGDVWKVPPHIRKDIAKEDKDLDLEVSSEGIDHVLKPSDPEMRSFFKSVSVTKVMGPDGTIEEHRTVKDSQGKIETTVSRRKGDQVFERTTITNDEGKKQVSEKVVNMDDRDLEQFTADWKRKDVNSTDLKDASSVLDMFFRGLFSRR